MKVLIVKTSSLGDVLHTFPALTDAGKAMTGIQFDWLVEESFAELPKWHPLVNKVIPIAFRRLRKTPIKSLFSKEWKAFRKNIKATQYDLVIDAQGLIKSALLSLLAKGIKAGLDKDCARESLASLFYQKKCAVNKTKHAVERTRELFAKALGYEQPSTLADYHIDLEQFKSSNDTNSYAVFLHGTTWETKLWPEHYWIDLAKRVSAKGVSVKLPWGNDEEKARAERIAEKSACAEVLPKLDLMSVASIIANAQSVVAVDTGLGHMAAAFGISAISLYGPTDPKRTGTVGDNQIQLAANFECAPCLQRVCTYKKPSEEVPACFTTVNPATVWQHLEGML